MSKNHHKFENRQAPKNGTSPRAGRTRAELQQLAKSLNASRYQNGNEWKSRSK